MLRESHGFAAQADFFLAELNSMTFPFCSDEIHFDVFFWKWLGTWNSMILVIIHLGLLSGQ